MFLLLDEDIAGTIDSFLNVSMFTQTNNKQRFRDGVMNEFLFWCRHPLVPLLFHEVTSLHPSSFQRNDFSTCYTYKLEINFFAKPIVMLATMLHVYNIFISYISRIEIELAKPSRVSYCHLHIPL